MAREILLNLKNRKICSGVRIGDEFTFDKSDCKRVETLHNGIDILENMFKSHLGRADKIKIGKTEFIILEK